MEGSVSFPMELSSVCEEDSTKLQLTACICHTGSKPSAPTPTPHTHTHTHPPHTQPCIIHTCTSILVSLQPCTSVTTQLTASIPIQGSGSITMTPKVQRSMLLTVKIVCICCSIKSPPLHPLWRKQRKSLMTLVSVLQQKHYCGCSNPQSHWPLYLPHCHSRDQIAIVSYNTLI